MRRPAWQWVAAALLAALGGGILWVYTHPPLKSWGNATKRDQYWRTFAIDVANEGKRPLTLTGITVNGEEVKPPFAVAAANFLDGEVASSVLMRLDERGHILESGPVPGWRMAPVETVGRYAYAVRVMLKPDTPPASMTISYRYLGLPMRLHVKE